MSPLLHMSVRGAQPDEARLMAGVTRGTEAFVTLLQARLREVEFRGQETSRTIALRGGRSITVRGGAAGNKLARRSGNAANSIYQRVLVASDRVTGIVGSPLVYVRAHEFGATITGKPWLYIPTGVKKPPVIRKRQVILRPRRMFATGGAAMQEDGKRAMRNAILQAMR